MNERWTQYDCHRCGITVEITYSGLNSAQRKGETHPLCQDCRSIDRVTQSKGDQCRGWRFDLDEFDRPIYKGKLWKPGIRTCGKSDCIRATHIIPQIEAVSDSEPVAVTLKVIAPKPPTKNVKWTKVKPAPRVAPKKIDWELDDLDLELLLPGATALDLEAERTSGAKLNS